MEIGPLEFRVDIFSEDIIHIIHSPSELITRAQSLVIIGKHEKVKFTTKETNNQIHINTGKLDIIIDKGSSS